MNTIPVSAFTWVDWVILAIICLSALLSLLRGFVSEALSLITWILALWAAWTFFREFADRLQQWIDIPSVRLAVAFLMLLVGALILGAVFNWLIGKLVSEVGLSGTDRMFGMLFGVARGVLIVAVLVLLAGLTPFPKDPWWQESRLIGYFIGPAEWLRGWLPPDIQAKFNYK